MKSRILAMAVLLAFCFALIGCGGGKTSTPDGKSAPPGAKKKYVFATGSQGGMYYVYGAAMAKAINEKAKDFEVTAVAVTSVSQSPSNVESNQYQIAFGMADMFERARAGEGEYKGKKVSDKVMDLMAVVNNNMSYLTLKDSGITNVKQLEGRTFVMPSAATKAQTEAVLKAAGVDAAKVKWRQASYQQMVDALLDGTVDAITLNTIPRNSLIDQVAMKDYRFIDIDEADRKKFNEANPAWELMETKPGTYPKQDYPVWGPCYFTQLYINKDVPEEHAYIIAKAIMEGQKVITAIYADGNTITPELQRKFIKTGVMKENRVHPGALRYYKEIGLFK